LKDVYILLKGMIQFNKDKISCIKFYGFLISLKYVDFTIAAQKILILIFQSNKNPVNSVSQQEGIAA
jgi:hypothetical protein